MRRLAPVLAALVVCALVAGCESGPSQHAARHSRAGGGSPSPSGPPTLSVVAAGDVLVHPPIWQQARADARSEGRDGMDFSPVFAAVRPVVSGADLAICHLETPVSAEHGPYLGWPRFAAPPQVLTAVRRTGFDDCSTASNHSFDQGEAGIDRTLDALDHAGLHHSGTARTTAEAARPDITEVRGVRVADLSYTFGLNWGLNLPAGRPWRVGTIDVSRILAAAHAARAGGADLVILSLHWGTEYQQAPTAEQVGQARRLLASPDVDLILGCHAHVVQPFESVHGKWVVYGMGNEIARHDDPVAASREGVMPRITFTRGASGRWRATRVEAVPTWVDIAPKIRLVDLAAALRSRQVTGSRRATYQREYDKIVTAVRSRGARVAVPAAR
ncbi:MAG: CapA family protein [Actinocatenispora sp.]